MPAAINKSRNKGKARAEPYDTSKVSASMPLGKQLAHTGMFITSLDPNECREANV
jgi:hypothetical protein